MGDGRVESRRRLCLVVDVERYSGRSYAAQATVQDGVAHALEQACAHAGLRRRDCERQDRGDGQLLLLPPEIDEDRAVPGLIQGLRDMLPLLNTRVPEEHLIRLRVALAQGAVRPARLGFVAWSVELASRLLDSAALRKELAAARGSDMALIVPDDLYQDLFARGVGGVPADTLRKVRVEIEAKKFAADAWLGAVPRGRTAPLGFPVVPLDAPLARPRRSFMERAGEAAVLVGGTLLMLPSASPPHHPPPDGAGGGPVEAPGHPADARAAGTADTLASTAGHVVDGPYSPDGPHHSDGPHPHPDPAPAAHDWSDHYPHPVEPALFDESGHPSLHPQETHGWSDESDEDDPDHPDGTGSTPDESHDARSSGYGHDLYDSDAYGAPDDTGDHFAPEDPVDPHFPGDTGHGGLPLDPHHPG